MKTLNKIMAGLDDIMSAVTFAEAGEFDTASAIMRRQGPQERKNKRTGKDLRATMVVNTLRK